MESPEIQEFNFYIGGEVKGPLSRKDAEALVAVGNVQPDTPCAPAGAGDWETASKYFAFGTTAAAANVAATAAAGPTIRSSIQVEKIEQERPELDPRLRKKVFQLGLATPATIDEFNESQLVAAVRGHEEGLRKARKARLLGGLAGFFGGAAAAAIFCITPPGANALGAIAGNFVKESDKYKDTRNAIASELRNVENALRELKTPLKAIKGGAPGEKFLTSRVQVPTRRQNLLEFKVDFAKLAELSDAKPRILFLKHVSRDTKKLMLDQANMVWKYKHPDQLTDKLDDAELAASWAFFKNETGDALEKTVKAAVVDTLEIADPTPDTRTIPGGRAENLVVAVDVKLTDADTAPFTTYFPYPAGSTDDQQIVPFSSVRTHTFTKQEMLEIQRYLVVEKRLVPGATYGIYSTFRGHRFFLEKKAPDLHYLGIRQEEIPKDTVIWVRFNEDDYNKTEPGALIPTKQLFPHECFTQPQTWQIAGQFSLKEEKK
jgi:hypothetical protein